MHCPKCGSTKTRVTDSRETTNAIRRRRKCEDCGYRFTTYERIEQIMPLVVKRDGTREEWDRNKLLTGIRLACNKRPVSYSTMQQIVDEIEEQFSGRQEVDSSEIGQAVMKKLRVLDEVAYIRFASVYLRFHDVNGFIEAVEQVRRPQKPPEEQIPMNI